MTDDELLYAANETVEQLKSYEAELAGRHLGKIVKAYGSKEFQVDGVEYQYGELRLVGFILKVNGTCGVRRYAMSVEEAEFIEVSSDTRHDGDTATDGAA
ncbi:hypothetical protein LPB73_07315 [Tardiphaga sp. 37S4]|uniref:hypothetical protein n=1 Tax=Tardiphaga sp. 37S4 TaxID=1404741 RepID=UPI001E33BC3C|nr:hypothetical protein [Tardiphaga sp. 37S4]UFS77177.1 hypothetical protein LPB73_07315 [Tardiphaga sp. 37S4]